MKIESKKMGIQYRDTARFGHYDILIYGQYRGFVLHQQDQKWRFHKDGLETAKQDVFDTQDQLEQFLEETYMSSQLP